MEILKRKAEGLAAERGVRLEDVAEASPGKVAADDPRRFKSEIAIRLVEIEGATHEEAAALVGVTQARVTQALAHARAGPGL